MDRLLYQTLILLLVLFLFFFFFSLSSDSEKLTSKRFCCLVSSCYYSILMNSAFPLHLFFLSSLFFFLAILHSSAYLNYFFFLASAVLPPLLVFLFLFRTIQNERFFFLFLAEWITQTIVVSVNVKLFFFPAALTQSTVLRQKSSSGELKTLLCSLPLNEFFEFLFFVDGFTARMSMKKVLKAQLWFSTTLRVSPPPSFPPSPTPLA